MIVDKPLAPSDLFLTEPLEIRKGKVGVETSHWPGIDTITVTHDKNRAITDPFIAEAKSVSNGTVNAEKADPEGPRTVLPSDEISIRVDTFGPDVTTDFRRLLKINRNAIKPEL